MEEFKIKYNYKEEALHEERSHWLVGCEIISAETYIGARDKFKKKYPNCVISDIEIVMEN
jgi:hypothetical protein